MTSTLSAPYHHGDLHEALAVEALEQVRTRGSEVVSLRAVAAAVGVSASAAYHHFPDKTALMQEVGNRGGLELDRRSVAAAATVQGSDRRAAVARLRACGAAYIGFARDEPHLFRHTFGADCVAAHGTDGKQSKDGGAYGVLIDCLDDLDRLGMLRRGGREGLDIVAWTSVHGFASLLIEGIVPVEATDVLLDTLLRTIVAIDPNDPAA